MLSFLFLNSALIAQNPDDQEPDDQTIQHDGGFNLFTPLLDDLSWSSAELDRHEFRMESLKYSDFWIRESSDFSDAALIGHPLNVFIPHLDGYVTFQFVHSETHINGITSHILEPGGSNPQGVPNVPIPDCFGLLVLAQNDTGLTGFLQADSATYLIKPVNEENSILYLEPRNATYSPPCNYCSSSSGTSSSVSNSDLDGQNVYSPLTVPGFGFESEETLIEEYSSARTCTIDLYVGSTPRASLHSSPGPVAANVVSVMNRALIKSKADEVRYRLAGHSVINTLEFFSPSIPEDAIAIVEADPIVISRMNTSGADVFMLLTQPNSFSLEGAQGVSEIRDDIAPGDRNTVIANIDTEARFTPQHELAHNHGCKHNTDDRDDPDGVSQLLFSSRGAIIDGSSDSQIEATIMSVDVPWLPNGDRRKASKRVLHFSNPDVNWGPDDLPTGSATRDNVAQLNGTGCSMSNFADREYSGVMINGTTESEPNTRETFTTEIKCPDGISNPVVRWFVSVNGGIYSFLEQNNGTLNYRMPLPPIRTVTFRAQIECNELTFTDFHTVYVNEPFDPCGYSDFMTRPQTEAPGIAVLQGDQMSIKTLNSTMLNGSFTVIISDLLGRVVYQKSNLIENTSFVIPAELTEGNEGRVHIVSVMSEDGAMSSSLMILSK